MRSHSGKDEGRNNLHDPTLRDKERAEGHSGSAILGEKKSHSELSREKVRKDS